MKKETRLKLVLTTLHILGWGYLLIVGIPIVQNLAPLTELDFSRGIGQIFGTLVILSPGLATAKFREMDGDPSSSRVVSEALVWSRATRRITSGGVGCYAAR